MAITQFEKIISQINSLPASVRSEIIKNIHKRNPDYLLSVLVDQQIISARAAQTLADYILEYDEDDPSITVCNLENYKAVMLSAGFDGPQIEKSIYDPDDFLYLHEYKNGYDFEKKLGRGEQFWFYDRITKLPKKQAIEYYKKTFSDFKIEPLGRNPEFGTGYYIRNADAEYYGSDVICLCTDLATCLVQTLSESLNERRDDHKITFDTIDDYQIQEAWDKAEMLYRQFLERDRIQELERKRIADEKKRLQEEQRKAEEASKKKGIFGLFKKKDKQEAFNYNGYFR